jgi:hypothetical protein
LAGCEGVPVGRVASAIASRQGDALPGETLQGTSLVGAWNFGPDLDGQWQVWLEGLALWDGQLYSAFPPRFGTGLIGSVVAGTLCNGTAACQSVLLHLDNIITPNSYPFNDPWVPTMDPSGNTYLYYVTVEDSHGVKTPLCRPDLYKSQYAIPIAGTWDAYGNHDSGSNAITFGCLAGVIAKCYKWGYQPWRPSTGVQSAADVHQACTRAARADYCGDGISHTAEITPVNIYDYSWNFPNYHVVTAPVRPHHHISGYLPNDRNFHDDIFEGAFGTQGALCISHWRYNSLGLTPEELCPQTSLLFGDPKDPRANICDSYPDAWQLGTALAPQELVPVGIDSEMYDIPTP